MKSAFATIIALACFALGSELPAFQISFQDKAFEIDPSGTYFVGAPLPVLLKVDATTATMTAGKSGRLVATGSARLLPGTEVPVASAAWKSSVDLKFSSGAVFFWAQMPADGRLDLQMTFEQQIARASRQFKVEEPGSQGGQLAQKFEALSLRRVVEKPMTVISTTSFVDVGRSVTRNAHTKETKYGNYAKASKKRSSAPGSSRTAAEAPLDPVKIAALKQGISSVYRGGSGYYGVLGRSSEGSVYDLAVAAKTNGAVGNLGQYAGKNPELKQQLKFDADQARLPDGSLVLFMRTRFSAWRSNSGYLYARREEWTNFGLEKDCQPDTVSYTQVQVQ